VTLTPHQKEKIERRAEVEDRSVSSLAAEAIELFMEDWQEPKPKPVTSVFAMLNKKKGE